MPSQDPSSAMLPYLSSGGSISTKSNCKKQEAVQRHGGCDVPQSTATTRSSAETRWVYNQLQHHEAVQRHCGCNVLNHHLVWGTKFGEHDPSPQTMEQMPANLLCQTAKVPLPYGASHKNERLELVHT